MASMVAGGLTFVVFFLALGITYLISDYVVAIILTALPPSPDPTWAEYQEQNETIYRFIMLLILPATFTFAVMKLLINAASRGRD